MAISGLAVDFTEIRARVAYILHGQRSVANLSTAETDNIDSVMKSGYRSFLNAHPWSFLIVEFSFPLQAGIDIYEMPEDFGGSVGTLTYRSSDAAYGKVKKVLLTEIQELRTLNTGSVSSFPQIYAEVAGRVSVTAGQLWKMHVWPCPDGDYTFIGRQRMNVDAITSTLVYPVGGAQHAETVLMACLAAAEQQVDDTVGVYSQRYAMELEQSRQRDMDDHAPESYGYNGNGPRIKTNLLRDGRWLEDFSDVGYDGG